MTRIVRSLAMLVIVVALTGCGDTHPSAGGAGGAMPSSAESTSAVRGIPPYLDRLVSAASGDSTVTLPGASFVASLTGEGSVLHLSVESTDSLRLGLDSGDRKRGGLTRVTVAEAWVDTASGMSKVTENVRNVERRTTVFTSDQLVRCGIVLTLMAQNDGLRSDAGTPTLSVNELGARGGWTPEDPLGMGMSDLTWFMGVLKSKALREVGNGERDGVPARHLVGDVKPFPKGLAHWQMDAWVRAADGLPITVSTERWEPQPGGPNTPMNTLMLTDVITRHYRVIERVPASDAATAFAMQVPSGTRIHTNLHLSPTTAAKAAWFPVRWLGPEWTSDATGQASVAADPTGVEFRDGPPAQDSRHGWGLRGRGEEVVADRHGGPRFSVQYGSLPGIEQSGGRGLSVVSYPHFALTQWPTREETYTATTVGTRAALLGPEGDVQVLLVDMGDATVALKGWGVKPEELVAAAKRLRTLR